MHDNTQMLPIADNPLWQFALATWQKPGVANILLRLQDEHGLNVNLLLLMLWLGERQVIINATQQALLQETIEALDSEVLLPFRHIRRHLKSIPGLPPSLYDQARHLELAFEQWQLTRLYVCSKDFLPDIHATSCQLHNLICCSSGRLPAARPLLATLLQAVSGHPA